MRKRYLITVSGKVQGVFYRASAAETARQLSLVGFVRNEADGSVYIEAEGEEDELKKFVEWCKKGPPAARVSSCDIAEATLQNEDRFHVKRNY